jgi:hypothetical protein
MVKTKSGRMVGVLSLSFRRYEGEPRLPGWQSEEEKMGAVV